MKDRLSVLLGAPVFLDSDDLTDLRELLRIVARSDVLILLQTTNVLTRAWCLLEIYTAICNHGKKLRTTCWLPLAVVLRLL